MTDTKDLPICHIVMWDVAGNSDAEKRAAVETVRAEFEALRGCIPGMTRLEIGVDISGVDYACDMLLLSEFDSEAALAAYAAHPAHLAVRDRLTGVRIARHQVDFPIHRPQNTKETAGD